MLEEYALLTGSSSIYHSLRCAIACAERLGHERPDWELAAGRLAHAVAHQPDAFAPKDEFAMDWYYPVLGRGADRRGGPSADGGAVVDVRHGGPGRPLRVHRRVGHGGRDGRVRPRPRRPGRDETALELLTWVQALRNEDGSYWTGMVYPEEATYPPLERSSYTAGAMILAADALGRTTPASGIFRGEGLPSHLDLTEPAPGRP